MMKLIIEIGQGQDPDIDVAGSDEFFALTELEQTELIDQIKNALDQYATRINLASSFSAS
jgi:hypothetical protein